MLSTVVFRGRLARSLRFGHVLEIGGKAKKDAKRFHIILSAGDTNCECDALPYIDLYFLVDFVNNTITLKKLRNNEWSNETTRDYDSSQFLTSFHIYIAMTQRKYQISINGKALMSYEHHLTQSALNFLQIVGDLEYIRQLDHRKYVPHPWPAAQIVAEDRLHFSNDVPMRFKPGHVVTIAAQLKGNTKGRFIVHLRNIWDSERQELHLSVRFDTRVVVWTSKTIEDKKDNEHYSFDQEQRSRNFPFADFHQPFKLSIAFAKHGLKFAKDGKFLFNFLFNSSDVLDELGGLKIFGIDGVEVNVSAIDHKHLTDAYCIGFEQHSQM